MKKICFFLFLLFLPSLVFGAVAVDTLYPIANGYHQCPSNRCYPGGAIGSHTSYLWLDEVSQDDSITWYDSSLYADGQYPFSWKMEDVGTGTTLDSLKYVLVWKKDASWEPCWYGDHFDPAGGTSYPCSVRAFIRSDGFDYTNATITALTTSYVASSFLYTTDPATEAAWTYSGFNNTEWGWYPQFIRGDSCPVIKVSQIYVILYGSIDTVIANPLKATTTGLIPNAVGTYSQWSLDSCNAQRYLCLDDDPCNNGAACGATGTASDSVSGYIAGEIITVNFTDMTIPTGEYVDSIVLKGSVRKKGTTSQSLRPVYYNGSVLDSSITTLTLAANTLLYRCFAPWTVEPNTGVRWTQSQINSGEFGLKIFNAGNSTRYSSWMCARLFVYTSGGTTVSSRKKKILNAIKGET